jgi:hypothetical protein
MTHLGPTDDERAGLAHEATVGEPEFGDQLDESSGADGLSETLKQAVEEIGEEWDRMRSTIGPFRIGDPTGGAG